MCDGVRVRFRPVRLAKMRMQDGSGDKLNRIYIILRVRARECYSDERDFIRSANAAATVASVMDTACFMY